MNSQRQNKSNSIPYVAETYESPTWDGAGVRIRCSDCNKVVVGYDRKSAELRAQQITERPPVSEKYKCVMKAYLGKCGHWHVSNTLRRRY